MPKKKDTSSKDKKMGNGQMKINSELPENPKKTQEPGAENLYRHKKNIYDSIRNENPFLN